MADKEKVENHAADIAQGERFAFGANWQAFLNKLDDNRIAEAERDVRLMLGVNNLQGLTFLDVGSGSGLSSLAARRLGAIVTSFDYDPASVACTAELHRRYFPGNSQWQVHQGSILNQDWIGSLGKYDIVYSWGVLHHTGALWQAMENTSQCVKVGGRLFIALYNDQGRSSRWWRRVKKSYCSCPKWLRWGIVLPCLARLWAKRFIVDAIKLQPFKSWNEYGKKRGMSAWHDVVDWVGGYPFEVTRPEEIINWARERGLDCDRLITVGGGWGCNQFVFTKTNRVLISDKN